MGLDFKVTDFVHQKNLALQLTVCRYHKEKKLFLIKLWKSKKDQAMSG